MEEQRKTAPIDRRADGPTEISAAGWWYVAKRTWAEAGDDNLGLIASGVAFYAFLAFVPLLTAVVLSYGLVASPAQVADHIAALSQMMPQQAAEIIGGQLRNMVETASSTVGLGLAAAIALAVYGATRGAGAIVTALNVVYDVGESRSFVWQTLTSLAITAGLVAVFILASLAISLLGLVESILPNLGGVLRLLLQAGFWAGAAVGVSLVVAIIYRYAPNRPRAKWRWLTPGSILATVVWIAATFGFAFYVRNFGSYNATYGSLGAIIVFLTWLYLSAYILLLGGELNQVLERRVGSDKALGGKDEADEAEAKSAGRKPPRADREEARAADGAPADRPPRPDPAQGRAQDSSERSSASFTAVLARLGSFALLLKLLGGRRRRTASA